MAWGVGPATLLRVRALPLLLLTVATAAACTPTGASETTDTTEPEVVVPEVTEPAIRLTPFCQQMIALDESLPDDPAIDTRDQVLEAYQAALPDVPPEIEVEFRAVIVALETGTRATVPGEEVETTLAPDQIEPTDTVPLDATVPPSPSGSTTLPSEEQLAAEEGWLPDDDPAARVNAYIDFACRGTANNPGPPATQPGAVVTTTEAA